MHIVDRKTREVVGFIGGHGGQGVGEFFFIHSVATDSKGNVYLAEMNGGRRVVRWNYLGMSKTRANSGAGRERQEPLADRQSREQ